MEEIGADRVRRSDGTEIRTRTVVWAGGIQAPLDTYYQEEVIGGPGAFLVVAEGFNAFEAAVRRKIIREIAAAPPSGPPPGPLVERVA